MTCYVLLCFLFLHSLPLPWIHTPSSTEKRLTSTQKPNNHRPLLNICQPQPVFCTLKCYPGSGYRGSERGRTYKNHLVEAGIFKTKNRESVPSWLDLEATAVSICAWQPSGALLSQSVLTLSQKFTLAKRPLAGVTNPLITYLLRELFVHQTANIIRPKHQALTTRGLIKLVLLLNWAQAWKPMSYEAVFENFDSFLFKFIL